jgi:hypothetical protein
VEKNLDQAENIAAREQNTNAAQNTAALSITKNLEPKLVPNIAKNAKPNDDECVVAAALA